MNLMNKLNNDCIHTSMDIKHNNLDFGHMFWETPTIYWVQVISIQYNLTKWCLIGIRSK